MRQPVGEMLVAEAAQPNACLQREIVSSRDYHDHLASARATGHGPPRRALRSSQRASGDPVRIIAVSALLRERMLYSQRWPISRAESRAEADSFFWPSGTWSQTHWTTIG